MSMPQWTMNFEIADEDIEYLTNLLLEREVPLSTPVLARALIERKLQEEVEQALARFRGTAVYNPTEAYAVGQRLVFPKFDYAIGVVEGVRPGDNPDYGAFNVIAVQFEEGGARREFAAEFTAPHTLSETANDLSPVLAGGSNSYDPDEILANQYDEIVGAVETALRQQPDLVAVAGQWFPRDLILEVNEGYLNLAEAVLDIAEGGPMEAETILDQIGGLGSAARSLQTFSMNTALNKDNRFDEVGPAGQVLWFLRRLEPEQVLKTPDYLRYTAAPCDYSLFTDEMFTLEAEIADEHSELEDDDSPSPEDKVTLTLIYPHRRAGTLPLNHKLQRIFPTARRTERIWVTLIDGQDGEEYNGWVVSKDKYVYGLADLYRKHTLPVGAYIHVSRSPEPGKIVINFDAYRPRTEWIRLITPKNGQISFENQKRSIGAGYDDLMIVGTDDPGAVDAIFQAARQNRRSLSSILRTIVPELSRLTPQGTVHAKTIYSAVNIIYRCPPAPIFAALANDPDFEAVGNHYWKFASTS